ncbi:AAA family ATPase [Colletotrichum tofieldiae]|nr:AAA family ATPase [Colletotrichum tofieldiae]
MQTTRDDCKPVWNGRQIRNAFQTAVALAEWHKKENHVSGPIIVRGDHFEKVARVSNEFNAYLYEVKHGRPDYEKAHTKEHRFDDFNRQQFVFGGQSFGQGQQGYGMSGVWQSPHQGNVIYSGQAGSVMGGNPIGGVPYGSNMQNQGAFLTNQTWQPGYGGTGNTGMGNLNMAGQSVGNSGGGNNMGAGMSPGSVNVQVLPGQSIQGQMNNPSSSSSSSNNLALVWGKEGRCSLAFARLKWSVLTLLGSSTYGADLRRRAPALVEIRRAFASREVVVAGGAFNSPQILQLSGIGNKRDIEALGIRVVVGLPGMGRKLQDNQEFPIVGHAQLNLTAIASPNEPTCAKGAPGDPCEELWRQGKGLCKRPGYNSNALLLKSNISFNGERGIFIFGWPNAFRGFWPAVEQPELVEPATTMGFSVVKMHPQNTTGYIKLRSADPTEPPECEEGAETDLGALADMVA